MLQKYTSRSTNGRGVIDRVAQSRLYLGNIDRPQQLRQFLGESGLLVWGRRALRPALLFERTDLAQYLGRALESGHRQQWRFAPQLHLQPSARVGTDSAQISGFRTQAKTIGSDCCSGIE